MSNNFLEKSYVKNHTNKLKKVIKNYLKDWLLKLFKRLVAKII
jgi:hypothetical protein